MAAAGPEPPFKAAIARASAEAAEAERERNTNGANGAPAAQGGDGRVLHRGAHSARLRRPGGLRAPVAAAAAELLVSAAVVAAQSSYRPPPPQNYPRQPYPQGPRP
ncbi:hypothetical protein I552_3132 [Mycobacterium xenopi 3993]|nr:hypothetical protein I552_3132 [Mycobacterium xenopi 3993]